MCGKLRLRFTTGLETKHLTEPTPVLEKQALTLAEHTLRSSAVISSEANAGGFAWRYPRKQPEPCGSPEQELSVQRVLPLARLR